MRSIQDICRECDTTIEEILALLDAPSELAPSEPAGPLPVVGSGGVVGLRVESAEALARSWQSRAEELRVRASEHRNHGRGFAALKNDERADTLYDCVNELRRQAGLSIPRQPEPNVSDQPRHSAARLLPERSDSRRRDDE